MSWIGGKLKRKDFDHVNDDYSDFSLSSPATKIRRLDTDLPPIIEEEDSFPVNHEKSIVLYNPNSLHLLHNTPPRPTLSFSVNSDLMSSFRNQLLRASEMKSAESEESSSSKEENEGCLAVVPWFPSQIPSIESRNSEQEVPESMETDEMDVEEEENRIDNRFDGLNSRQAIHNWAQQQHCMLPQPPPQNPFTPITWSG